MISGRESRGLGSLVPFSIEGNLTRTLPFIVIIIVVIVIVVIIVIVIVIQNITMIAIDVILISVISSGWGI